MSKNIIVIEGSDGTGKSTVAKMISDLTGFEVVTGSSFEIASKGTDYMFDFFSSLAERENIIIDRCWLSNYVYGRLYDKNTMSDDQFRQLVEKFDDKTMTLILNASEDVIIDRINVRGDDYIKTNEIKSILDEYEKVLDESIFLTTGTCWLETDEGVELEDLTFILNHFGVKMK